VGGHIRIHRRLGGGRLVLSQGVNVRRRSGGSQEP
jgi:hypothetical protein